MDVTTELRWYERGTVSPAMAAWFGGTPSPYRTDHYSAAAAAAELGLKVRAGERLELKARREEVGVWSFGERASGRVETWEKWMFPLASAVDEEAVGEGWLRVEKGRRLRRFAIDLDPTDAVSVREVTDDEGPRLGCYAELTDLVAGREPWWTLAFEVFGEVGHQLGALRAVASLVLGTLPGDVALSEARSMAYPAWLASLDRGPAVV